MDATKSCIFKQVILVLAIMQAGGIQAGDRDIFYDVENKSLVNLGVAFVLGFCAKNMFDKRKSNKPAVAVSASEVARNAGGELQTATAVILPYDTNRMGRTPESTFILRMTKHGKHERFMSSEEFEELWEEEKKNRTELETLWRQDNAIIKNYKKKRPRGRFEVRFSAGVKAIDGNPKYPNYRAYEESMKAKIRARRQKQGLEQH